MTDHYSPAHDQARLTHDEKWQRLDALGRMFALFSAGKNVPLSPLQCASFAEAMLPFLDKVAARPDCAGKPLVIETVMAEVINSQIDRFAAALLAGHEALAHGREQPLGEALLQAAQAIVDTHGANDRSFIRWPDHEEAVAQRLRPTTKIAGVRVKLARGSNLAGSSVHPAREMADG